MKAGCYILISIITFILNTASAQQVQNAATNEQIAKADSLFNLRDWKAARKQYETALQLEENKKNALALSRLGITNHMLGDLDQALKNYQLSLTSNPSATLKPIVLGRMARIYAFNKQSDQALSHLKEAVDAGYLFLAELDTAREFNDIRNSSAFREVVTKAEINAFPCKGHPLKRQFDFWVGEWDVFVTGTNFKAGHSLIQKASGDCMILENWTGLGPVPNNGKSMNYVNPQTNKWEQLWIGSGGSGNNVSRFYDGEYKDSVMQFVYEASTPQGKQTGRFRFFNQGTDQVRQLNETSPDGGKTWNKVYDFTYKRKK
ncbi:MAG TPA: tetratricopeptide repeat protein [Chitinophagaceae bacterium]